MEAYIETNCTIVHEGRILGSGGAVVTPDYIVAYPCETPTGYRPTQGGAGDSIDRFRSEVA